MAGRIKERNLAALDIHLIGGDRLRDAARFAGCDLRMADVIHESRLAVVYVTEERDDRRTRKHLLGLILRNLVIRIDCLKDRLLVRRIASMFNIDLVAVLLRNLDCDLRLNPLVDGGEHLELHKVSNKTVRTDAKLRGKLLHDDCATHGYLARIDAHRDGRLRSNRLTLRCHDLHRGGRLHRNGRESGAKTTHASDRARRRRRRSRLGRSDGRRLGNGLRSLLLQVLLRILLDVLLLLGFLLGESLLLLLHRHRLVLAAGSLAVLALQPAAIVVIIVEIVRVVHGRNVDLFRLLDGNLKLDLGTFGEIKLNLLLDRLFRRRDGSLLRLRHGDRAALLLVRGDGALTVHL